MKSSILDTPVLQFISKLADLVILNLLFIAFSLPVITYGASKTAMYRVLFAREKGDESPMLPMFWQAFRASLLRAAMLETFFLVPIGASMAGLYFILSGSIAADAILLTACCLPLMLFALLASYAYPVLACRNETIGQTIKQSALLAIRYLPISVMAAGLNAMPILLTLFVGVDWVLKMTVVWLLIGFSALAWANAKLLKRPLHTQLTLKTK